MKFFTVFGASFSNNLQTILPSVVSNIANVPGVRAIFILSAIPFCHSERAARRIPITLQTACIFYCHPERSEEPAFPFVILSKSVARRIPITLQTACIFYCHPERSTLVRGRGTLPWTLVLRSDRSDLKLPFLCAFVPLWWV